MNREEFNDLWFEWNAIMSKVCYALPKKPPKPPEQDYFLKIFKGSDGELLDGGIITEAQRQRIRDIFDTP